VREREDKLQTDRDAMREEKARLSEEREDYEDLRKEFAIRKSLLVEKDLKLKDREQHLEELERRQASRLLAEVSVQTEELWLGSSSVVEQKTRGRDRGRRFSALRAARPTLVMAVLSLQGMQLLHPLAEAQCPPCPGVTREPHPEPWGFDLCKQQQLRQQQQQKQQLEHVRQSRMLDSSSEIPFLGMDNEACHNVSACVQRLPQVFRPELIHRSCHTRCLTQAHGLGHGKAFSLSLPVGHGGVTLEQVESEPPTAEQPHGDFGVTGERLVAGAVFAVLAFLRLF